LFKAIGPVSVKKKVERKKKRNRSISAIPWGRNLTHGPIPFGGKMGERYLMVKYSRGNQEQKLELDGRTHRVEVDKGQG